MSVTRIVHEPVRSEAKTSTTARPCCRPIERRVSPYLRFELGYDRHPATPQIGLRLGMHAEPPAAPAIAIPSYPLSKGERSVMVTFLGLRPSIVRARGPAGIGGKASLHLASAGREHSAGPLPDAMFRVNDLGACG